MKTRRSPNSIHIDLTIAEARTLLEELSNVRGGSRLPKLRQVCAGLEASFSLADWAEKRKQAQKQARPILSKVE